jgi:DNA-binding transcriptional ArsR family regulator
MRILEEAGLLSRKKQGREHHCRLEQKRLRQAEAWIEDHRKFWNERLDALERYLKENP